MTKKTGTILDYQGAITSPVPGREDEAFHPNWGPAAHEAGVAYICPWEDPAAGFPEHARRCARALDDAGMPVHLRSLDASMQVHMHFEVGGADTVALQEQYDDLLSKTFDKTLVEIYQVVPDDALLQRLTTHQHLDPRHLAIINRFRVLSCVFERDRVSEHAVRAFNAVGEVWVANLKDMRMLMDCGVERVAVVPIPHFDNDPLLRLRGRKRQPGPVRFYHIGKWEPRKAHHEMLGAFLMAFKPGDAKLYFKTSTRAPDYGAHETTADYLAQNPSFQSGPPGAHMDNLIIPYPSSPEASAHQWAKDERVQANGWTIELINANIYLIKRRIPSRQIVKLHELSDVYLSLSRGEGFDMPAYDATLCGNLLVYTPSGGPQDYESGGIRVPAKGSVQCHPFYKWGDARYLDWEYQDAVHALRAAKRRIEAGWGFETQIQPALRGEAVGSAMRDHLRRVLDNGQRFLEEQRERERAQET